jgi:class 3 adenylate cyclase/tetratricopeptide (TPR) repeat protein
MKCPKCQHFNDAAAKFCAECATPLAPTCSRCGRQLPSSAKFCPECAQPTGVSTNASSSFGAPETYTPKHLVSKILNSRAGLEGERKQVTVLFADLKGSMELLSDRDPEEARKLLDPVLELMMEAVHHYEGTVSQAAGDGIMAIFGAPLAHEDHAVRACYAALRMQEGARRHAEAVFHAHGVNLQIRVGVNSGEVVVGTVGSDLRMDYTAVGRTTHLAARMEQLANPGSILVTPSTLELVDGFVTVKPLGPVPIKGLSEPLEVHEVTGVGPVRTRFQSVARRGLTPFVGRERELEHLRQAQQLAGSGHGQVVALVAEGGVGKSRLVYELAHSPVLDGWLVMESAAVSYGKTMSYLAVANLLKGYFEITEQDSLQTISDKVKTKLLALDGALAPTLPALLALLDAPVNDSAWQTLDPSERRRRMLDGVRYLLLREARQRPLLLIFEDLHWIDNETQAVLDGLVESLGSARVLLLATYRPEYQHGWAGKTYYGQLPLDALVGESGSQLVDALLGDDPTLSSLKQLLANHGNPFFLEETVRALVETKALEGSSGSYRLTRPIEAIQVPATVQVLLASRIDRLSLEDKHLLQIAAVIGRRVPFSLLRVVADLPDDALREGLDRLQAAEFVYETGLFPALEYSFKHALTQEVAYGGILQDRRRDLHARIVEAIETLHHNRLDEQVELLAHHALRGDLREKAVGYWLKAGQQAVGRSAMAEAVVRLQKGLELLSSLPEGRQRQHQELDLRVVLGQAQVATKGFAAREVGETFARSRVLVEQLDRPDHLLAVLNGQWVFHLMRAELRLALSLAEQTEQIGEARNDPTVLFLGPYQRGVTHFYLGEFVTARTLFERCQGRGGPALRAPIGAPSAVIPGSLAQTLAYLGYVDQARAHANQALAEARRLHHAHALAQLLIQACFVEWLTGSPHDVRRYAEEAVALSSEHGFPLFLDWGMILLGWSLSALGKAKDGVALLTQGLSAYRAMGGVLRAPWALILLAEAHRNLGRPSESLNCLNEAAQIIETTDQRYVQPELHRLRGDLLEAAGDRVGAQQNYRLALTIAARQSAKISEVRAATSLTRLWLGQGKREDARDLLAPIYNWFTEGSDTPVLKEARAVLEQIDRLSPATRR